MKRYIKSSKRILSSINSVDALTTDQMLRIQKDYRNSDGSYGPFEGVEDLEAFTKLLFILEDSGYEI